MKKSYDGKTITLEELHKKNRELWNKAKAREPLKSQDKNYVSEKRLDDFFHPDNIFNKTRNFPVCPASANAATIGAERKVFDDNGKPVAITDTKKHTEAAKLLLFSGHDSRGARRSGRSCRLPNHTCATSKNSSHRTHCRTPY